MTAEDLSDPKDSLERIFSIQTSIREYGEMIPIESGLTNEQAKSLLRNILCPLQKEPKLFASAISGTLPKIIFTDNKMNITLDKAIGGILESGITNIQIISCAPSGTSLLEEYLTNAGNYPNRKKEVAFTTCRKFKGLEADAVILIDVDYNTICDQNKLFYVGASRARLDLYIVCNLSDEECTKIIQEYGSFVKKE